MELGHPDGVLVGLGAAVGEEHHVEIAGGELADQAGRFAGGGIGVERRNGGQSPGLFLNGGHEFGVLVADVHVHELAGKVEVPVAGLVPDPGTLAARNDEGVQRALGGPRVEHVGAIV